VVGARPFSIPFFFFQQEYRKNGRVKSHVSFFFLSFYPGNGKMKKIKPGLFILGKNSQIRGPGKIFKPVDWCQRRPCDEKCFKTADRGKRDRQHAGYMP